MKIKQRENKHTWFFPITDPHAGIPQGNGVIGTLLWGAGNRLCITVGRADFWDRRGGLPWRDGMSYQAIRRLLETGDEAGLRRLFEDPEVAAGEPRRPTVLPVGRFELVFPEAWHPDRATLDLDTGAIKVSFRRRPATDQVRMQIDMATPLSVLQCGGKVPTPAIRCVPAWEFVGHQLKDIGFEPPRQFDGMPFSGWTQSRPGGQAALAVAARCDGDTVLLTTAYGDTAGAAADAAQKFLESANARGGYAATDAAARSWWRAYRARAAKIRVPNERLQFLYDYGLYKFAGLTHPAGVAATLQGPWIEEYQLPPWSSDYHFNINVQMCYWPAFQANLLDHLQPLFAMIRSWLPRLRENARVFLGIEDGLMLPHGVDDRGVCMGGFWTGSIDHGCTAWVADMMFRAFRYGGDRDFLATTAFPFMQGAMRVYEEMLEETAEGFCLPVSISPEYRGAALNAWGRNASFQMACIHRLCENLVATAIELGAPVNPLWRRILAKLPKATLTGPPDAETIALWEDTPLEESHRHHSHLAGITPFDIFPEDDPAWAAILRRSLDEWVSRGPGNWSGWCMPWAAMLHTRFDNGAAAELTLETWQRVFTNAGHGTLHDVAFPGYSLMGVSYANNGPSRRIMQIEAGMAATAAIQEMLLHHRRGIVVVFGGIPARWREASFSGMLTEGGFLVDAALRHGQVAEVRVHSQRGGLLRLRNPWPRAPRITGAERAVRIENGILHLDLSAGETARLRAPRQ